MKTFIIFIVKLALILGIACFALTDLRFFSFDKGFSATNVDNQQSVSAIKLIENAPIKVEYYKKPIVDNEYEYLIYIVTKDKNYLLNINYNDIETLTFLGFFVNNVKPKEIYPVPFYVELILGFLVLIIPFGSRKRS